MDFFIKVALISIWLYGLKIRDDMHKQNRSGAIRALSQHDPVTLFGLWARRRRAHGPAPHNLR